MSAMSDMSRAIRLTMEAYGGLTLQTLPNEPLGEFVQIVGAFYMDLKDELARRTPATPTADDSVYCRICDPPHETSIAMFAVHLASVHDWTQEQLDGIAEAPVYDATDPRAAGS